METDQDQLSDNEQTSDIELAVEDESQTSDKFSQRDNYLSVVPWQNPEQFMKVYKWLYSPYIKDKQLAVNQISVWETRSHPSLPTAIEASVVLVRAAIQDELFKGGPTFCQEKDIQMLYAMSLVRFINLTVESSQKTRGRSNLSALANECNIPRWIVDLRHEATHALCPSLPVLRMGAEEALKYLEDNFWKVEATNIQPIIKRLDSVEETVRNLIDQFRLVQFRNYDKKVSHIEFKKDFISIMKEITCCIQVYKKKFIDTFVKPGVFINAEDVVRLLRKTGILFLEEDEEMSLPSDLESFWFPVIRRIFSVDLIPYFLEMLLINQEKVINRVSQKVAVAWVIHIFQAISPHGSYSKMSLLFRQKGIQLNLHRLLYATLKGTNRFTLHIFPLFVDRMGRKRQYDDFFKLITFFQGKCVINEEQTSNKRSMDDELVFTVEDLEIAIHESRHKRLKKGNVWSLTPACFDFSEIPLGAVINGKADEDEVTSKDSGLKKATEEKTENQRFILPNISDSEDSTVEERVTVDNNSFLEASALPQTFDMLYRR